VLNVRLHLVAICFLCEQSQKFESHQFQFFKFFSWLCLAQVHVIEVCQKAQNTEIISCSTSQGRSWYA